MHSGTLVIMIYPCEAVRDPSSIISQADDWKNASQPDLTLTGHEDNAEFALSISSASAVVASAGRDTNVSIQCRD